MRFAISFHLTIDTQEAAALQKVLGNLTDEQFRKCGLDDTERAMVGEIWNALNEWNHCER